MAETVRLVPSVPAGCEVIGRLYFHTDHRVMSEDMVEVVLPNGVLVSAGWYQNYKTNEGNYRVDVSCGLENLGSECVSDLHEANAAVEKCCTSFLHWKPPAL